MKRKGNILSLLVSEARVQLAKSPEEREEAAADLVIVKLVAGMRIAPDDLKAIQASLVTAESRVMAARKVG